MTRFEAALAFALRSAVDHLPVSPDALLLIRARLNLTPREDTP